MKIFNNACLITPSPIAARIDDEQDIHRFLTTLCESVLYTIAHKELTPDVLYEDYVSERNTRPTDYPFIVTAVWHDYPGIFDFTFVTSDMFNPETV